MCGVNYWTMPVVTSLSKTCTSTVTLWASISDRWLPHCQTKKRQGVHTIPIVLFDHFVQVKGGRPKAGVNQHVHTADSEHQFACGGHQASVCVCVFTG